MKVTKQILFSVLLSIITFSCNTAANKVTLSPEMEDFVNMFDGKFTGVTNAIQKYANAPDLNTQDMDTKDLKRPDVTAVSEENGNTCYTLLTNDGLKDCKYIICWKDKKIVSISDITQ